MFIEVDTVSGSKAGEIFSVCRKEILYLLINILRSSKLKREQESKSICWSNEENV